MSYARMGEDSDVYIYYNGKYYVVIQLDNLGWKIPDETFDRVYLEATG